MWEELTPREKEVLSIIVEGYIQNTSPIGSRYVSKKSSLNLSPATMRNIMADLTDKGYLKQPHTSAGRIPTEKGFRFYVGYILRPKLLSEEKQRIKEYFKHTTEYEFSDILEMTSRFISHETRLLGMAVAPKISFMKWKQIDFVLVKPGMIMAILVFEGGIVHHRIIEVSTSTISGEDLMKFSNYLNDRFKSQTLHQVKIGIRREMEEAQKKFSSLYINALKLAEKTCEAEEDREVFVEGTAKVIDHIDPRELERMKLLLEFLEKRSKLLKLLDKIDDPQGIFISFGKEVFGSELEQWSIISSPYGVKGRPLGIIGTIGPIYMNYSRLIPMVDYMAKMLSEILEMRL